MPFGIYDDCCEQSCVIDAVISRNFCDFVALDVCEAFCYFPDALLLFCVTISDLSILLSESKRRLESMTRVVMTTVNIRD